MVHSVKADESYISENSNALRYALCAMRFFLIFAIASIRIRHLDPARVFETEVTSRTRLLDFARAGIPTYDDEGRKADLHSLRVTLGTTLARLGVQPQVAMRIMRLGAGLAAVVLGIALLGFWAREMKGRRGRAGDASALPGGGAALTHALD